MNHKTAKSSKYFIFLIMPGVEQNAVNEKYKGISADFFEAFCKKIAFVILLQ